MEEKFMQKELLRQENEATRQRATMERAAAQRIAKESVEEINVGNLWKKKRLLMHLTSRLQMRVVAMSHEIAPDSRVYPFREGESGGDEIALAFLDKHDRLSPLV
ncbi:BNR/Asp-box repeat family protein [Striga asiatica]|uniref:BNR/Asp-box repeat family protein n=1 Tax=Striga asiatica TaxID=4170 RepID=A0A5A7P0T3_STRAF|nr:BNR/Asp-box repeat family protein [Striga asiatica]